MDTEEIVDYDIEMTPPAVVSHKLNIFGVSNLSTKDIISFLSAYFGEASPEVKIEWIDDSSCNAVFDDPSFVTHILHIGTPIESGEPGSVSLIYPPVSG